MQFIFLLLVLFIFIPSYAKESKQNDRREYARVMMRGADDSEANDYYIKAIFFDIDADGKSEALMAEWLNDHRDGCGWCGVAYSMSNSLQLIAANDMYCRYERLYVCEAFSKSPLLVGRDILYWMDGATESLMDDVSFTIPTTKDKIVVNPLKGGFEQLICHPHFRRLSPAPLSKFEGFDLRETVYGTFTPLPDNPVMPPPSAALKTLIQNYRQKIKTQYNLTQKFAVYTISLDADNDGDEDVYISSYPERVKGDQLKWHLYMNQKGVYQSATKRVWLGNLKRDDTAIEILDPEEVASPFAFYRLSYYGMPRIIIFDNKRGRGLTYTYLKLISSEDHARRPPEGIGDADRGSDWHMEMKEKNGCPVPFTVREYLMSGNIVIERIPCRVDIE